jgi:hypothetical protein
LFKSLIISYFLSSSTLSISLVYDSIASSSFERAFFPYFSASYLSAVLIVASTLSYSVVGSLSEPVTP